MIMPSDFNQSVCIDFLGSFCSLLPFSVNSITNFGRKIVATKWSRKNISDIDIQIFVLHLIRFKEQTYKEKLKLYFKNYYTGL